MKLFLLPLMFTCFALCQSDAPFACNMKVFQPQERKQHEKLSHEIVSAVTGHREVDSGYAFQLDPARVALPDLARWVSGERKCCPFFDFQINLENGDRLSLTLTGRDGVKAFIREEFRPLFAASS
jgi:hypothetical protein